MLSRYSADHFRGPHCRIPMLVPRGTREIHLFTRNRWVGSLEDVIESIDSLESAFAAWGAIEEGYWNLIEMCLTFLSYIFQRSLIRAKSSNEIPASLTSASHFVENSSHYASLMLKYSRVKSVSLIQFIKLRAFSRISLKYTVCTKFLLLH